MRPIPLLLDPGNGAVRRTLLAVVERYEAAFPGQIAAYYLVGSQADASAVATSDIDVVIIFAVPMTAAQQREALSIWADATTTAEREVDLSIETRDALSAGAPPQLKLGGRLLYGQDVLQTLPLIPLEAWTRDRMHAACWLLAHVYERPMPLALEVDFPDPADEFYGYLNRQVTLPTGEQAPCTRNLIRTTGWIASALLARQAGVYVGRKRDVTQLYRQHLGDEWADYLDALHQECLEAWHYLIPEAPAERARLRALSRRARDFERFFLASYRAFVLEEPHSADPAARAEALRMLRMTPLRDAEIEMLAAEA